jgi:hypothetical protein
LTHKVGQRYLFNKRTTTCVITVEVSETYIITYAGGVGVVSEERCIWACLTTVISLEHHAGNGTCTAIVVIEVDSV